MDLVSVVFTAVKSVAVQHCAADAQRNGCLFFLRQLVSAFVFVATMVCFLCKPFGNYRVIMEMLRGKILSFCAPFLKAFKAVFEYERL